MTGTRGAGAQARVLSLLLMGVVALVAASFAEFGLGKGHAAAAARVTTMTIGEPTIPATLDPRKMDNGGGDVNYAELAYDPLVNQTPSGKYLPDLAASWGYVGTGNTEFQFKLRSGVKFSDGSTMTAQDVVNTITAEENSGTTCASYISTLTSVTAPDANTVDLKFSAPVADAQATFDQSGMCGDIVGSKTSGTVTDGTGPYMLDPSQTVTGSTYVYVQNPHYWNKSLRRYKKFVVNAYSTPQAELNAALSGQIDFMTTSDSTQVPAAQRAGLKLYSAPSSIQALWLTDFDGKLVPALANQKVRQAIAYAINRPALAKAIYGKYAQANDNMIVPGFQGYVGSMKNYYPYNPKKAKELLKEAGYPHFTMYTIASADLGFENTVQGVVADLAKVGITVKIKQDPTHDEAVVDLFNRKYPSFVWDYGAQDLPLYAEGVYGSDALFNPFHNPEPVVDGLLNKANATTGTQATKLYQQIETYAIKQAWTLNLFDVDSIAFVKPGTVANVQMNLSKYSLGPGDVAFWSPPKSGA